MGWLSFINQLTEPAPAAPLKPAQSPKSHGVQSGSNDKEKFKHFPAPELEYLLPPDDGDDKATAFASPAILVEQTQSNPWKFLAPSSSPEELQDPSVSHSHRNVDVTLHWDSNEDDMQQVAKTMMEKLDEERKNVPGGVTGNTEDEDFQACEEQLVNFMGTFVHFCHKNLEVCGGGGKKVPPNKFKVRIVISRGHKGTKCPKWHYDVVPVRWIQSLVGPGCDYVVPDMGGGSSNDGEAGPKHAKKEIGINWQEFGKQEVAQYKSIQDCNDKRVDPTVANICQVPMGQAVLLLGSVWNQYKIADDVNVSNRTNAISGPGVHKSPMIQPGEGRLLLTLDVIPSCDH